MPQNPYNPNPRPQNLQDPQGPSQEPDTWWGGAWKGLKDYGRESLQGVLPMLEDAAQPSNAPFLAIPGAGMGGNLGGVSKAAEGLIGAAPETFSAVEKANPVIHPLTPGNVGAMERMYQQNNPIFREMEAAGRFGTTEGRSTFSSAGARPMRPAPVRALETLGEANPEFTPMGGEDMYNVGRPQISPRPDPRQAAYNRILANLPAK